ncbi:MAG TPA: sugar phosphate isomerase/epimerase family protein [Anaerolineae bacterium]|nr:sugar phosphate isomerase/epimerase family protein [Anaerolineae bacterium]HQK14273.1 sugar phosphate isomerase/epimerase family protein [Anaerolineae bacterium]
MKLGVCADPNAAPVLAAAGFEFLELHVQNHLKTTVEDEAAFLQELARIRASALPCVVANCFLPANLRVTGPDINRNALAAYAEVVFERAAQAGIDTIVFGSGGARRVPDDFERGIAWQQLVEFGDLIGPLAQRYNIVVVVEPLNQRECNILTGVAECGRYVEAVDHPNVRLLVDAYHWLLDDNDADAIVTYGPLLHHVHIATATSRRAPGIEACDFTPFFRALKASGYEGRISIEAGWQDMAAEAPVAFTTLRQLLREAGW